VEKIAFKEVSGMFESIKEEILQNRDYLIQLDAKNGDGDLGISMSGGFSKTCEMLSSLEENDLGKIFMKISKSFNEAAPSTMGTLLSIAFMGMARSMKGQESVDIAGFSRSFDTGVRSLMEKGGAAPGEKTIVDALYPAAQSMISDASEQKSIAEVFRNAEAAANAGMEKTKDMRSVHGRAAYYGDKSIGIQDGGATVGMLIMKGCASYFGA
jgi:phosphoenolpyruvate---glycerone phosphotransferase subunit DhaL